MPQHCLFSQVLARSRSACLKLGWGEGLIWCGPGDRLWAQGDLDPGPWGERLCVASPLPEPWGSPLRTHICSFSFEVNGRVCLPVCIFIGFIIAHWIFWGLRERNTGRSYCRSFFSSFEWHFAQILGLGSVRGKKFRVWGISGFCARVIVIALPGV